MKKIGKIILIISVTLIVLLGALIGSVFLFQDKLKRIAIEQVNQHVKVPIDVKGGIDVTFLSSFPSVSVNLNDVRVSDQLRKNEKLITVEKVSLLFNLYEVFDANKKIREIVLENGTLFLLEDASGKMNFDILKESNDTASSVLELQSVLFKNIDLSYKNVPNKLLLKAEVKRLNLHGNFGDKILTLKNDADFKWNFLRIKNDTFNINKPVKLALNLTIDKTKKNTRFKNSTLKIGDNDFAVNGNVNTKFAAFTELNFDINCKGEEISSLISLLPNSVQQNLQGAKGTGEYAIDISISGRSGKNESPKIQVAASLKNGTLEIPRLKNEIKNVNFQLTYDNKKEVLSLQHFNATFQDKPIEFSLLALDLNSEIQFDLRANGIANFQALQSFIPNQFIKDADGEIEFKSFQLLGKLNEEKQLIPASLNGSGSFTFHNAQLQSGNVLYNNINGTLTYKNDFLEAENFTVDFLKSQFTFNGNIRNILPYIIEKIKRENNTALTLDGEVDIKNFNLTEMLKAFQREEKEKQESIDLREIFNINGNLKLTIDAFRYEKLVFEDVKTSVLLSDGQLKMNSFYCRAMGGELTNAGVINFTAKKEMILDGNLQIKQMELPKIFEQSDNFGQTTLTNKHIKGAINADVSYHAVFDDYKNINLPKLTATLNCSISKGELVNFEPLREASAFIRLEDLNRIYFSDLKNQLIIKNSKVEIPQMEIQSSALNLLLNGSHT
ncbi:MAG TPA: AsmA-like C-terminal region-containing protein, partial [Chitinophagales bacterium]